ncbi:MAG: hypothetical protein Q8R88_17680 [Desulfoprunum sp.]|nr:hypothetical protein [Desulfoprunum sp.]
MIFCKECGGALNLFETHDEEVCYSCLRKTIPREKAVAVQKTAATSDLLTGAVLSHEGNTLVLRSPEGWVLWSAPDNETHSLNEIIKRARRIHEIRSKRQK